MKRLYKKSLYKIFVSLFVVFYSFVPQVLAIDEVITELRETNSVPIEEEIIPEESLSQEEVVLPEEEVPPVVEEPLVEEPITVIEDPAIEDPVVEEPIIEPEEVIREVMSYPVWVINDSSATTYDVVKLGETYIAPQNSRVRIIFTKLPENPSKLTIKEITLTQEEINATGAVSDKAYDIKTDMVDGTFEYDLTLPLVGDSAKIGYAENEWDLISGINEIDSYVSGDVVKSENINHFTVFLTYADAGFSTPKISYLRGEVVYMKATGLTNSNSTYYRIDVIDPNGNSSNVVSCQKSVSSLEGSYSLSSSATTGNWSAALTKYSSNELCRNKSNTSETINANFTVSTNVVSNPPLTQSCGLDIALVIDISSSINSTELGQMKSAMISFVNSLEGTPTQFSVTKFGTNATVVQSFTSNFNAVRTAINNIGVGISQGTNWEEGISTARSTFDPRTTKPNLMIFASDGNPTYPNCGGGSTCQADVDAAVAVANVAKSAGIRILALGIGDGLNVDNLKAISGNVVNGSDLLTTDVITTDFSTMAGQLADFASQTCGGTISVNKYLEDENTTGGAGWVFTLSGTSGATLTTDSNGQANSGKIPTGTYSIAETLVSGYSFLSAECTDQDGAIVGTSATNGLSGITIDDSDIITCDFINTAVCVAGQHSLEGKVKGGSYTTGNLCSGSGDCWSEGENVLARLTIDGLLAGRQYSVVLEHDYKDSNGVIGYENFNNFSATGASGLSVSLPVYTSSDSTAQYTVSFTATSSTVVLDWNALLSDEAGQWNGASLHYRLVTGACGGVGNKDIPINPGQIVVLGSFTPIKSTENGANPLDWTFNLSGLTSVNGIKSGETTTDLALGTNNGDAIYTITEAGLSGWELVSVSSPCVINGSIINVTLTKDNPDVSCTFVNKLKTGTIIVDKVTNPSGSTQAFNFTTTGSGYSGFSLSDSSTPYSQTLVPGTYSVSEDSVSGWTNTSAVCVSSIGDTETIGNLELDNGETITCTFTNTKYASLTIVKNANPDSSQDFSFLTSGTGLSVFSLDDDTDGTLSNTKTFTNLLPGTYSVTESTVSGWDLTNAVCSDGSFNTSINLSAGEDVTCTFTNTMRGAIGGHKYNDADGDILTTGDRSGLGGWTVELYQNDQLKANTTTASDGTYGFSNLVPGEYKLKEVLQDGWFALHPSSTGDGFINVTLSPGENDFANNFINTQGASITIYKNIDTDGDGDIDENHSTSWKWNIDSTEYSTGTIVNNLYPSSYTISEQQQTGYHVSSLICNNGIASANHDYGAVQSQTITLSSGQNLVCTFTNTRDTGTIELKKVWSGTPGQTNLNIGTIAGGTEVATVQTGTSGGTPLTTGQQTVPTGTYYLSESGGLDSYTKSPLSCFNDTDNDGSRDENESMISVNSNDSVSVATGNHIVCSYTNTRQQGTIIVKKVMVGGTDTFTFTGTPSGTISTNEGTLSVTVDTGSYTTIESDLTGWKLTNISCNDGNSTSPSIGDLANKKATFNIEPGETVECIFTNEMFGSVTAYKYHDFNQDGNQDAGEPGLPGWNMTLYTGSNCQDGNSMETKSTDINGNATFSSIIPGQGYSIKESQKDGWENVSDMCQNFTVTAGEAERINFGNIQKPITIKAHKIVCTDESQLPNWGAGGPNITATTAQDWVNSHNSCTFVGDWNFQWGNEGSSSSMNPGDNTGETSDIRWHKFGPTVDGLATVEINANQFSGFNSLWMREVWNSNYIPFTYNIDGNNSNHVTAEIYCHTDVLNYDNLDRIDNIKAGETYYCVAWNVESKEDLSVTKTVDWAGITPDSSRTFEICISGPSYPNGDCKTSDYDGEVLIWTDLLVGGYTVTETDPGSHWSVTGSGNTITVGHEIPATHTVVNTYKPYCGDGVINQESEQCDGKDGVSANGSNFCTSQCKLIPIYNGANSCAPGTTPVKVGDTHILGSQDSDGVDISLSANQEYLFKVSGTYQFGSNANRQADAAYGTENNWNSTRDDLGIWGTSYKGVLSVLANLGAGVGVVIWDNDSVYNSPHVYQKAFTPSDAMSAQFLISDWYDGWYGDSCDNQGCMNDNSGSLELEVYECQAFGSIQGRKYYDVNINGDFDQFEKEQLGDPNRLNGWTIELYDEEWVLVNSMVTGDDATPAGNVDKGQYRFIDVVPGTYNICEESREGWYQTEPSTGIQHNNLFCHTVTVDPGQAIDTIQFGNYQGSDVNICKKDNYDRGLQDWKVILASEQVQSATSINVSNGSGTKSSSLPAGTYLIKVSGTYKYGNSQMIADAGYSFRPMGIPSGTGGWVSGLDLPSNGLMAWVNENPVNWGAYNDAHQYSYVYEHTGGSVNISIYDDYYGDNINNNNFVFEVYEVNDWAEDTTGENGCVVLDAVPYGEYILDEFLKDGWVDMSGKGDTVKVNDLTEDFTIKNRIDAPVTIKATKIVCDYEEDLPNWGAVKSDGNPITQDRINQFLTDTGGKCRVVPDWEFEWGYQGANNPGDDLVGYGGDNWNTFTSSVQINQLQGGRLEFREVLQENYIPFTYASNGNNSDNFSAEFYCHNDVMNYDNWEWLNTPEYGQTYYCVGFNTLTRTDVHGYKWLDIDRDGDRSCIQEEPSNILEQVREILFDEGQSECEEDDLEPRLSGWKIFIDTNKDGKWDEGEQYMLTSSNTEDSDQFGSYLFEDLLPGEYKICEEMPDEGWAQTYPGKPTEPSCHIITLPNDCNNSESCEFNFGNVEESELYISETNDSWPNILGIGDTFKYTITVRAEKGPLTNVVLVNLPPKGIIPQLGTFSAVSSEGYILDTSGVIYASPGTWNLGNLKKDETVTITYIAKVTDEIDSGIYPDLSYAYGTGVAGSSIFALSEGSGFEIDDGIVTKNYVGTQIQIGEEPEIEEGEVLGTSIELPATGAQTYLTLGAILSMILGFILLVFNPKRKIKNLLMVGILLLGISTVVKPTEIYAISPEVEVQIEQPASPTKEDTFKIGFVALDLNGRDIKVQCYVNGIPFGPEYATNSGNCEVTPSIITSSGIYNFYVKATPDGGTSRDSSIVSVQVTLEKPLPVTNYVKTEGVCTYTLTFKTANDTRTSKVEIFRSSTQPFTANASTRIHTETVGPNKDVSYTDTSIIDCSKEYYYAIRALDDLGNFSTFVTDNIVTITQAPTTGTTTTTVTVNGETGEVAGEETTAGEETEGENGTGAEDENGDVKGDEESVVDDSEENEDKSIESIWDKYKYVIIAAGVVVLGSAGYSYVRRKK